MFRNALSPEARHELRQLRYHGGWLLQNLQRGDMERAMNVARATAYRVGEDLRTSFTGNKKLVHCEVCGWEGNRFYPYTDTGMGFWEDEVCANCGCLSRHRLQLRWVLSHAEEFKNRTCRVLEIGPWGMKRGLTVVPQVQYVAIDLRWIPEIVRGDATQMPFQDNVFDIVVCFNVIVEIPDDKAAVREMARVCKPGGKVVLSEPLRTFADGKMAEKTEDFDGANSRMHGMRRFYGLDFPERFASSGLCFDIDRFAFEQPEEVMQRYGLKQRLVFVAEKLQR